MKIFLIRHGETEANIQKLVCGQLDSKLTENGKNQCIRLQRIVNEFEISSKVCFVSSLSRSVESAKLIFKDKFELIEDNRLIETNTGSLSSLSLDELSKVAPIFLQHGQNYMTKYPEGESINDVYTRHLNFINERVSEIKEKGEDLVICAHGGTINCFLHFFLSTPLSHYPAFNVANASLTVLNSSFDEKFNLEHFNYK